MSGETVGGIDKQVLARFGQRHTEAREMVSSLCETAEGADKDSHVFAAAMVLTLQTMGDMMGEEIPGLEAVAEWVMTQMLRWIQDGETVGVRIQ